MCIERIEMIMKSKVLTLLLVALIVMIGAVSFAYSADGTGAQVITQKSKRYHILFVGNSFNWDSSHYLRKVARTAGYDVTAGLCYKGGSSVISHYRYCSGEKPELLKYREYGKNKADRNWQELSFEQVLDRYEWDAVVFQMTTGVWHSGRSEPDIDMYVIKMADIVREHCLAKGIDPPVFGANMTWSYDDGFKGRACFEKSWHLDSKEMYVDLMSVRKEEVENMEGISFFIPTGTAVQNARTSYLKPKVTRDGQHMSYGYGRHLAALCVAGSLGIDIDDTDAIKYDICAGNVSTVHLDLLKRMAKAALEKPFGMTDFSRNSRMPRIGRVKLHAKRSIVRRAKKRYACYTLSWKPVKHATGYKVYYKKRGTTGFKLYRSFKGNTGRTVRLRNRSARSHYTFRVYSMGDDLSKKNRVTVYR